MLFFNFSNAQFGSVALSRLFSINGPPAYFFPWGCPVRLWSHSPAERAGNSLMREGWGRCCSRYDSCPGVSGLSVRISRCRPKCC